MKERICENCIYYDKRHSHCVVLPPVDLVIGGEVVSSTPSVSPSRLACSKFNNGVFIYLEEKL